MPSSFGGKPRRPSERARQLNRKFSERLTRSVIRRFMKDPLRSNPFFMRGLESKRPEVRKFFKHLIIAFEKGRQLQAFEKYLKGTKYKGPFYGDWIIGVLNPYFKEISAWRKSPEEYFEFVEEKSESIFDSRVEVGSLAKAPLEYQEKVLEFFNRVFRK